MSTLIRTLAKGIATAGGAGYSPVAPGTCGTLVAVPLAYFTSTLSLGTFWAAWLVLLAVAIWAAGAADRAWGTHDSGRIVIDEVVGYLVTVSVLPRDDWRVLLAGFVAFRFFDIVKPPPVRWLDRNLPGGAGVVLDDVAAGIMGAAVLWISHRFFPWT